MDKIIFLVGFMGAGKTYWGKKLAHYFGAGFVDLDARIEKGEGMPISALFRYRGETVFRAIEGSYLRILLDTEGFTFVSTGGGAPCFFDNMDFMNRNGLTIWLDVPPAVLAQRLAPERAHRPLLAQVAEANLPAFIEEKLAERQPFYARAQERVVWDGDEALFWETLRKKAAY